MNLTHAQPTHQSTSLLALAGLPVGKGEQEVASLEEIAPTPRKPKGFLTAKEILQMKLTKREFLVPDLLPVGLCVLAGKQKTGKSFLALQLSLAVALGRTALGKTVQEAKVLFLALEDDTLRMQERIVGLLETEPEEETISKLENLMVFTEAQFRRIYSGGLEDLDAAFQETGARLLVIDVLNRITPQNSKTRDEYAHYSQFLAELQTLAFRHRACILLVHHVRKGASVPEGDPFDAVMGSSAITGAADVTIVMDRPRMQDQATLTITGRDVIERQERISRQENGLWVSNGVVGADSSPPTPTLPYERQRVIDAIRAGYRTPREIADHLDKKLDAVKNILLHLHRDGLVIKPEGRGVYSLSPEHFPGAHLVDRSTEPHTEDMLVAGEMAGEEAENPSHLPTGSHLMTEDAPI